MKFSKSWIIAGKDFKIFRKKKRILYALIVLPLLLSVGLPIFLISTIQAADTGEVAIILNAFSFFYIILAYILPNSLAAYSILGEKIEYSLEPLLATPITDGELLLGKMIASFLPCVAMIYIGSVIFMALSDIITSTLFFPNWTMVFILIIAVPLASILSIQLNIIISSRVNDVRTANQLGILLFIPFIAVYVLLTTNIMSLNILNLLLISAVLLIIDVVLFYINKATFNRDKILTKWN